MRGFSTKSTLRDMGNLRDRKAAEMFLVRWGRATAPEAARLSDDVLARLVIAAGARRSASATTIAVAKRRHEIECEARRRRGATP